MLIVKIFTIKKQIIKKREEMKNLKINKTEVNFNSCYSLFESENPMIKNRVQAMRVGDWSRDEYKGRLITLEDLQEFKNNFDSSVLGQETVTGLPIDAEHNWSSSEEGACGWIKNIEITPDGNMFLNVEWTDRRKFLIENKRFKHLSAMFADSYEDPESGNVFKNVLFGAALTVLPYIQGMEPVTYNAKENVMEKDTEKSEMIVNEEVKEASAMEKLREEFRVSEETKITEMAKELEKPSEEIEDKIGEDKNEQIVIKEHNIDADKITEIADRLKVVQTSVFSKEEVEAMNQKHLELEKKHLELEAKMSEISIKESEINEKEIDSVLNSLLPSDGSEEYSIKPDQADFVREILKNAKKSGDMYKFSIAQKEFNMYSALIKLFEVMPKNKYNKTERGTINMETNKNEEKTQGFNLKDYIESTQYSKENKMTKFDEACLDRQKKLYSSGKYDNMPNGLFNSYKDAEKEVMAEIGINKLSR